VPVLLQLQKPEGCLPDVWSQLRDLVEGSVGGAAERWLEGLLRVVSALSAFIDFTYFAVAAALIAWTCAYVIGEYASGQPMSSGNWVWIGFMLFGMFTKIFSRWHHSAR
jgi:hypothetical protein